MKHYFLCSISMLLTCSLGFGQNIECGFDYVMANIPNQGYLTSVADCNNNYVDWMENAPHTGSYTVPIVFHVMHDNGPENISDAQIYEAVRLANLEFSGFYGGYDTRIKLALASTDPNGNCTSGIVRVETPDPHGYLINFIKDWEMKDLSRWDRTRYLNIWIVRDIDFGSVAGYAYLPADLSGDNLKHDGVVIRHDYVGNTGTAVGNGLHTLSHEIAHALGLYHPWGRDNNVCDPNCHEETDGWIKGDLVKDTNPCKYSIFANSNECEPLTTNCSGCSVDPMAIYPKDNYMAYAHACQDKFTNGQAERMWYTLETCRASLVSYANSLCTGPTYHIGHNFDITTPTIWSASNVPNGNGLISGTVTIENGGSLNISSDVTLSFCNNGKIIVSPGGTLYLGGKVTNICETTWRGIEVTGLANSPQQPYSPHLNHGLVLCRPGSIIENAEVGILASDGGMISAIEATFSNCEISVQIKPYTSNADYYAGFTNCTFFTNYIVPFKSFIDLEDVRGVKIFGGSFTNGISDPLSSIEQYGYGIFAKNAGFKLKAKINYDLSGNYLSTNRTSFEGLGYGIFITNDIGNKIYQVRQAIFDNCYFGIYNNGMNLGEVVFNDFTLNTVPNEELIPYHLNGNNYGQIGVLLKNDIEGITFENNEFNNTNIETHTTVGTLLENVGIYDNIIRKNDFHNISIANTSSGENAWNATYPLGITYLCNTLTGSENYDFIVLDIPNQIDVIKNHQGLIDPSSSFPNYVWFSAGNKFSYSDYPEGDFKNASYSLVYHYKSGLSNEEPINYSFSNIIKKPSDVNSCISNFCEEPCPAMQDINLGNLKTAYLDLRSGFNSVSNQYFSYTLPSYPSNLPTSLEKFSPYNPANPPIGTNPPVNDQLNLYKQEMLTITTKALSKIAMDTNAINLAEYLWWIGQINSYNSDIWLAEEYAELNDWTNANIILNYLPIKWALTGLSLTEHNYRTELINMLQVDLKDLSSNQIDRLTEIRQISSGNCKYLADNILYRLDLGNPVTYHLPDIDEVTNRSSATQEHDSELFSIFPNPTSGKLTVSWSIVDLKLVEFRIFNSLGQQILKENLVNKESIDLSSFGEGLYFYRILSGEDLIHSGKVIFVR